MKFVDELKITVQSGAGGKGSTSFRRERFIPKGGPDGGDGGDGGGVVVRSSVTKKTLCHIRANSCYIARNGISGRGNKKNGKSGDDLVIEVPVGTSVFNLMKGHIICDLVHHDDFCIVATGGKGGRGNNWFKSATNRSPKFAQPGKPGEVVFLKLELKILADVGIMGLPNVGKSTLLSRITSAKPKIGNYSFTTLVPNLGVVYTEFGEPIIFADIPGLIEGAYGGLGLGSQFLRHIERTKVLLHLVDATGVSNDNFFKDIEILENELFYYGKGLLNKPRIFVLNKIDCDLARKAAESFSSVFNRGKVVLISAVTGEGIDKLLLRIVEIIRDFEIRSIGSIYT